MKTTTTVSIPNGVSVIYFHGKHRCNTCEAIEKYAQMIVNEDYKKEVAEGKLEFKVIDFSIPENEKIANQYKIAWSALLIVKNNNGKETVSDITDFAFNNALKNTELYKNKLKESIDQSLQ